MRGRCVCTAFRSSHARLGAANPEKWHRYSVRKGAPTARVPSLGCLAALVLDPKASDVRKVTSLKLAWAAQTREVHARHFRPTQVAARAASRRKFPGITQSPSMSRKAGVYARPVSTRS